MVNAILLIYFVFLSLIVKEMMTVVLVRTILQQLSFWNDTRCASCTPPLLYLSYTHTISHTLSADSTL